MTEYKKCKRLSHLSPSQKSLDTLIGNVNQTKENEETAFIYGYNQNNMQSGVENLNYGFFARFGLEKQFDDLHEPRRITEDALCKQDF